MDELIHWPKSVPSLVSNLYLQGMTNNVGFTFSVGDNLELVLSETIRNGDTTLCI